MGKRILLTLLAIGLLSLLAGLAGFAVFTDQATIPSNNFTTGSVDISTTPTTALVTFKGMVPGDAVQPTAGVVVSNDGTLELRYAITSTADNADGLGLNAALDLTIREIDVTLPATPCDNFDGAIRYGPADLGSVAGINVIGDPAQGAQAGDRVLAAGTTETLCFRVELPSSATGPSGAATTATFTFNAEQTVNNP
ncbi:MAG: TasA family protein [Dehalococcoidia bacterium]|nr:TasA family protein [Dehalococcoidia bacterium]